MRNPTPNILTKYAPLSAWTVAEKQASRSPFKLFKTGAVLLDNRGNIVSRGCSHMREASVPRNSVHAEQHTLMGIGDATGLSCLIVTINKSGNWAGCSKCCSFCTHILHKAGVKQVIYAERSNDGEWTVNVESLESLISRVNYDMINETYTKQMRVA